MVFGCHCDAFLNKISSNFKEVSNNCILAVALFSIKIAFLISNINLADSETKLAGLVSLPFFVANSLIAIPMEVFLTKFVF